MYGHPESTLWSSTLSISSLLFLVQQTQNQLEIFMHALYVYICDIPDYNLNCTLRYYNLLCAHKSKKDTVSEWIDG